MQFSLKIHKIANQRKIWYELEWDRAPSTRVHVLNQLTSVIMLSDTKMKSGLPMGSPCAAQGLPTEAVGSSVDRSFPFFMYTHYNICPWAAHGQLSGQELPTNFRSLYNILPWAAHRQLKLLDYIVGSSVGSSDLNTEKVVGSGQLQHRFSSCHLIYN